MSATLKVTPLGGTYADVDALIAASGGVWTPNWETDADATLGELMAEFAGRACYQSWTKPNPATATNAGYLKHILEVGHYSVLRHATATLYIEGVSRSLTHELIRHHVGIDFSQLSQRYVDSGEMDYVIPPAMRRSLMMKAALKRSWEKALEDYAWAAQSLEREGKNRKKAREAARAFLPNCAETKIVVTANLESWRNFIEKRGTEHADAEIRELAVAVTRIFKDSSPRVFQDFEVCEGGDGITTVCRRPL